MKKKIRHFLNFKTLDLWSFIFSVVNSAGKGGKDSSSLEHAVWQSNAGYSFTDTSADSLWSVSETAHVLLTTEWHVSIIGKQSNFYQCLNKWCIKWKNNLFL